MDAVEASSAADAKERPRKPKQIKWDEATIAEHDKERGTRMKIDEPDTPFVRLEADGGELVAEEPSSADDKAAKGTSAKETTAKEPSTESSGPSFALDLASKLEGLSAQKDSDDRVAVAERWETTDEEEERKRRFKERRNAHYNEMEMLKKWKAEHEDEEDDEDLEEDEKDGEEDEGEGGDAAEAEGETNAKT